MIVFDTNIVANNATTQYSNFDFNSIVKFDNQFLCADNAGLFKISGTTKISQADDLTYISTDCYFELATMDFDISSQKRLRAVYIGYEADGDLTLKISTELSSIESYTLPATTSGQHARKVSINRSLKGRYWTFQIYGSGVTFAIDHIKILPIVRGHGFDQN